MRPSHTRTKRPRGALLQLGPVFGFQMCRIGGSLGDSEIPLFWKLDTHPNSLDRDGRQGLVGSLTGAVTCKRVTQAPKGTLSADGNRAGRAKA